MKKQANNILKKATALAVTTALVVAPAIGITTPVSWDTSITASAATSISSATWAYDGKHKTYNGEKQSFSTTYLTLGSKTIINGPNFHVSSGTTEAINAGTYTWKAGGHSDYTGTTKTFTWYIDKIPMKITAPTAKTLTYTGSAQALVNAGTASGGSIRYRLAGGSYPSDSTIPTATNAGTYDVYYKGVPDGNHTGINEKGPIKVTISPKPVTITAPTAKTLTYTGSAQALVNAGSASGGTIQYSLSKDSGYDTSIPKATNAGTYYVYYKGVASNSNYSSTAVKGPITVTISPKPVTITAPTAKTLTYTGSAQALVNAGTASGGTMQYKLEGGSYSTAIPKGTNAGSYKVYYKGVASNSNYSSTAEKGPITVTIGQKPVPVTAPKAKNLSYTGQAQELVTAGAASEGGTIQYKLDNGSYSTAIPKETNAGSYKVYYKGVATNSNYKDSAESSVSASIGQIPPTITQEPVARTGLDYIGVGRYLITAGSATNGTMQYKLSTEDDTKWRTTVPIAKNVGTYTVEWKVVGTKPNYSDITGTPIKVSITAVPPIVTTAPKAITGLKYTGNAQELITAGTAEGGTIMYSVDNGAWNETIPSKTDAGNYNVRWKVVGDSNHLDIDPTDLGSVTIAQNKVEVTVTANTNLYYNGQEQALVTVEQEPTFGTLEFSTDDENWNTQIPTAKNVGTHLIYYRVLGTNNYTGIDSTPIFARIRKSQIEHTKPTEKEGLTYNSTDLELINAGTVKSGGTMEYTLDPSDENSWTPTVPTGKDAKTYIVYWRITPDGNHEGIDSTEMKPVVIEKAVPAYAAPVEKTNLKYNKQEQELIEQGIAMHGTMLYRLEGEQWSTSIPTGIDADDYTVYYMVKGDPNYVDIAEQSVVSKIKKAVPTITKEPEPVSGLHYTGNAQNLCTAGETDGGTMVYSTDGENWTETLPTGTNIGTYTVYYQVNGGKNYYDVPGGELNNINIDKTPASYSVEPTAKQGLKWTGEEQRLVTAGIADGGTVEYSLNGGEYDTKVPTAAEIGEYTIQCKITPDNNHTTSVANNRSFTVKIDKNDTEVTLEPKVKTGLIYNSQEQELITAGRVTGGTMQYSIDNGATWNATVPTKVNAGTYNVIYRVVGDNHYNGIEGTTPIGDVTIAKRDIEVTVTGKTLEYNDQTQTLVDVSDFEGGTIQFSTDEENWDTELPSGKEVKTYPFYYKVVPDNNHNGIDSTYTTAKIVKAPIVYTDPTAKDLTYNGQEQELITAGTVEQGGTMYYSTDGENWDTAIPTGKNAIFYDVYYKIVPDKNHIAVDSTEVPNTRIKKADPTIVQAPAAKDLTYNAQEQELITAGEVLNGTIEYYNPVDNEWTTSIPTALNAVNYPVKYRVKGNQPNYNDIPETPIDGVAIGKDIPVITTQPAAKDLTYTGTAQELVTAGEVSGGTIMYNIDGENWIADIPKATDAGSYTVYYKVDGGDNYENLPETSVEAEIKKAPSTVIPAPQAIDNLQWTGNEVALITVGQVTGGTIKYSMDDGDTWSEDVPTATEIDEYSVWYRVYGDKNHKNINPTYIENVKIVKADVVLDPVPAAKTGLVYNGQAQELITAGTAIGGTIRYRTDETGWGSEIPTATAEGTYNVYYEVIGDEHHNNIPKQKIEVTISPISYTVKFDSAGGSAVADQIVPENGTVQKPEDPTQFNYTFLGWYNGTKKYDFGTLVTGDITLTAEWEITNELLAGNTVSFKDNLNLNFLGKISDDAVDGAYVKISYIHYGTPTEFNVSIDPTNKLGKYYRFPCELTASEMTMVVKAELYLKDSTEPISTRTRSIRDYCIAGLEDPNTNAAELPLLRATLNYGGYTQTRFGYNKAPYAYDDYKDSVDNVTVSSNITTAIPQRGFNEGIEYYGASVFFKNAPFVRYYFRLAEGSSLSDYTFTLNGETVVPHVSGNYYCFEASPSLAYQLDKPQTVVVKKGDTEIFNFNYSAVKWAENAANDTENTTDRDMAKSLYVYYQAAKAYVERNNT